MILFLTSEDALNRYGQRAQGVELWSMALLPRMCNTRVKGYIKYRMLGRRRLKKMFVLVLTT
jgi:hypothetical protein